MKKLYRQIEIGQKHFFLPLFSGNAAKIAPEKIFKERQ